jgi:hypothetical protein
MMPWIEFIIGQASHLRTNGQLEPIFPLPVTPIELEQHLAIEDC